MSHAIHKLGKQSNLLPNLGYHLMIHYTNDTNDIFPSITTYYLCWEYNQRLKKIWNEIKIIVSNKSDYLNLGIILLSHVLKNRITNN